MVLLNNRKNTCRKQRVDMFPSLLTEMISAKYRFYGTHVVNLFPSLSSSWVSEWVGAVTCEQALLFGRAKRVSRLRANEWWSREGPRTPFLGPLPARFRETRFARLNRRACSQAIGAAAGWCNNYISINNENWTRKWMTIWPWRGRKVLSVAHVLSWITVSTEKKLNKLIMINALKS